MLAIGILVLVLGAVVYIDWRIRKEVGRMIQAMLSHGCPFVAIGDRIQELEKQVAGVVDQTTRLDIFESELREVKEKPKIPAIKPKVPTYGGMGFRDGAF